MTRVRHVLAAVTVVAAAALAGYGILRSPTVQPVERQDAPVFRFERQPRSFPSPVPTPTPRGCLLADDDCWDDTEWELVPIAAR